MSWGWRRCFWIGLLFSAGWLDGADSSFRLIVRIYDYASVPETTLARAEREASRIYLKVGVEVVWVECASACRGEEPADALNIPLSILSPSMESLMRTSAHIPRAKLVSGIAVGDHAYVFSQRVTEICEGGKYPQEVVLGHLMAHELGHVLLGENSHSPEGIMSGKLNAGELRLALNGLLFFDLNDALRIRDRLAKQVTAKR